MKKKLTFIIIVVLLLAVAASLYLKEEKGIAVETEVVRKGNIRYYIEEVGTVKSHNQREISLNASGIANELKYEIGDTVNAGDVLLTIDMDTANLEIKSLESKLSGLIPDYEQAVRDTTNSEKLYQQGAISYEAYQSSIGLEQQMKSQISEIQYNIKQLKETKENGSVSAPISGVVTEIYVQEGEVVSNGSPIMEIADLEDLYIEVQLLIGEANEVIVGAPVNIVSEDLDLFLEDGGKVGKIYPKAHMKVSGLGIEQKRVTVEIQMSQMNHLKLGYDVDVEILSQSKEDVIVVPETAVFEKEKKHYVFLAENGEAVLKQVETGIKNNDAIEIIEGLLENDVIILSPNDELEEGSQITSLSPLM